MSITCSWGTTAHTPSRCNDTRGRREHVKQRHRAGSQANHLLSDLVGHQPQAVPDEWPGLHRRFLDVDVMHDADADPTLFEYEERDRVAAGDEQARQWMDLEHLVAATGDGTAPCLGSTWSSSSLPTQRASTTRAPSGSTIPAGSALNSR